MTMLNQQQDWLDLDKEMESLLGPDTDTPEERAEAEERRREFFAKLRYERRKARAQGRKEVAENLDAILDDLLGPDATTSEAPAEAGARNALQDLCAALDDAIGPNAAETTPAERADAKEAQERRLAALAEAAFRQRLQVASEAVARVFAQGIEECKHEG